MVFYDLLTRLPHIKLFYTDAGVLPLSLYLRSFDTAPRVSAYFMNDGLVWVLAIVLAAAIAATALFFGWKTRIALVLSWFLLLSLHVRNPFINTNGDHLLRLLLAAAVFLPFDSKQSGTSPRFEWANLYFFFQVCFIYWFAAAFKSLDPEWRNGTALLSVFSNPNVATPLAAWMLRYPGILAVAAKSVIWLEWLLPLALFIPGGHVRLAAVLVFAALQLSFGLTLFLGFFPWVTLVAVIPFIPSLFWDRRKPVGAQPVAGGRYPIWANALAVCCLAMVFLGNVAALKPGNRTDAAWRLPGRVLYLDQTWAVFCPPGHFAVWYEMPAVLRDGTAVDISPFPQPRVDSNTAWRRYFNPNMRWERYLSKIWHERNQPLYAPLREALRKDWDTSHPPEKRIDRFKIFGMKKVFYPKSEPPRRTSQFI